MKIRPVRILDQQCVVWGHWFGCSLWPETPLNLPSQEVGFICPFVDNDPIDLGATTVGAPVAPGATVVAPGSVAPVGTIPTIKLSDNVIFSGHAELAS